MHVWGLGCKKRHKFAFEYMQDIALSRQVSSTLRRPCVACRCPGVTEVKRLEVRGLEVRG